MSKESNDIKILTPEEQLRELLSTNQFAKKTMQQIFSLIDKSANIDDKKFNQELSKVKKLAYEKGARIDYTPQYGLRDLSILTKLGNKIDNNELKKITPEEIKNIIENAPEKKPSYYKQDEQKKGAVTNHESVDRHSDETFLSSANIDKAKELLKTQPTKSIIKKEADSLENPKPKKTVRFGDENGLKIDVREIKSKEVADPKIDYEVLKWGTQQAYNYNLEKQIESFVNIFKAHNLRPAIEDIVVQYAASKNDNLKEKTGHALADWAISRNKNLASGYNESLEKRNTAVKEEVQIYRESIEKDLLAKKASSMVISDVLNEFDKSITTPINSANPSQSSALLASRGFEKFGDIIGAPAREKETRTASQINQAQYNNIKNVEKQLLTVDRVAELQAENDNIKSSFTRRDLVALNLNNRLNIPLPAKLKQAQEKIALNQLLMKEYQEIVQPTISMEVRANQKSLAKEEQNKYPEASIKEEKTARLIQDKIKQIKETPINPETQTWINELVRTSPLPQRNPTVSIGQRGATPIIEERLNNEPASNQKAPVSTKEARRKIPKSPLAQRQATSQDSKKILAMRGSVELPDNNLASPELKRTSSLPNIKGNIDNPSQPSQNPDVAAKNKPEPQIGAGSPQMKQETISQTQEEARIDALWTKLHNNKNTRFLTEGTTPQSSHLEKAQQIRKNISTYKDGVELNNLKMNLKLGEVDKNFKNIKNKDTKIIELSSKALSEINNGTIEKADSYLNKIDDLTKPGLLKKAAIVANDKIVQPLDSNIDGKVQELQNSRSNKPHTFSIETAKNIGIDIASAINKYAVQKIADKSKEKTTTYKKKLQERTR